MLQSSPTAVSVAIILLMITQLIHAQPHGAGNVAPEYIDSLAGELRSHEAAKDFTAYALTAEALSEAYVMTGDFTDAIRVYNESAEICRGHQLFKWYGVFKKNIAEIDFMMGRIEEARVQLEELSTNSDIPDYEMTAIRFRLGDLECDLGNYEMGVEILESSLQLAERSGYDALLGSIYTELGLCNNISGHKVRAIDYLISAIPHLSAPKHSRVLGHNYLVLAEIFEEIGQSDKSTEYLAKGKQLALKDSYDRLYYRAVYLEGRMGLAAGDENAFIKMDSALAFYKANWQHQHAAKVALDISSAKIQRGKAREALVLLNQAADLLSEADAPLQRAKYHEQYCRYYIITGNTALARKSFNLNRALTDSIGGSILVQRSLALEVDLLQAESKLKEALVASFRYHAFKDSVNTLAQNRILFDTEAKFQKEENEKAIELLSTQNQVKDLQIQRVSRRNMMLLLGLMALVVIVGIGVYSIRLKQRTKSGAC